MSPVGSGRAREVGGSGGSPCGHWCKEEEDRNERKGCLARRGGRQTKQKKQALAYVWPGGEVGGDDEVEKYAALSQVHQDLGADTPYLRATEA